MLRNDRLGALRLKRPVSVRALRAAFPGCVVKVRCGQSDGPDLWSYDVTAPGGEGLFTIYSGLDGRCDALPAKDAPAAPTKIDVLVVRTPRIPDVHGVRVGMPTKDVLRLRKQALDFGAVHHEVALGAPPIYYLLWAEAQGDRDPGRVERAELANAGWRVTRLSWPYAAW